MAETIKPCPFCGGVAEVNYYADPINEVTYCVVKCQECESYGASCNMQEEAIPIWNNRPTEKALVDALLTIINYNAMGERELLDAAIQDARKLVEKPPILA